MEIRWVKNLQLFFSLSIERAGERERERENERERERAREREWEREREREMQNNSYSICISFYFELMINNIISTIMKKNIYHIKSIDNTMSGVLNPIDKRAKDPVCEYVLLFDKWNNGPL